LRFQAPPRGHKALPSNFTLVTKQSNT
jgi:hypothetical protein